MKKRTNRPNSGKSHFLTLGLVKSQRTQRTSSDRNRWTKSFRSETTWLDPRIRKMIRTTRSRLLWTFLWWRHLSEQSWCRPKSNNASQPSRTQTLAQAWWSIHSQPRKAKRRARRRARRDEHLALTDKLCQLIKMTIYLSLRFKRAVSVSSSLQSL